MTSSEASGFMSDCGVHQQQQVPDLASALTLQRDVLVLPAATPLPGSFIHTVLSPGVKCMSLQDVEGVLSREGINGYGVMAQSGPEVNLSQLQAMFSLSSMPELR